MKNEDFRHYQKYARKMLRGDILQDEKSALQNWLECDEDNLISVPSDIAPTKEAHEKKLYGRIRKAILNPKRERIVRRISAAAVITVAIGVIALYNYNKAEKSNIVKVGPTIISDTGFLAPGGNRAVLTLSDGKQLTLNNCHKGNIADDEGARINKDTEGSLSYKPGSLNAKPVFNTLQTPVGGQYHLVLPDGTKVWLNSKSSLQYPTAFSGKERRVVMTGEAYFEVAHDTAKPFHVDIEGLDIKVLGTHFNVNGYKDDGNIRATLIEGSIIATSGKQSMHINPEQECRLDKNGTLALRKDIDVNEVLAWKDGEFDFGENADIHLVMNQLARWYDFDIDYQYPSMNARVAGGISKNVNGYEALKMLEKTGAVRFKINGKKVTVMSP